MARRCFPVAKIVSSSLIGIDFFGFLNVHQIGRQRALKTVDMFILCCVSCWSAERLGL